MHDIEDSYLTVLYCNVLYVSSTANLLCVMRCLDLLAKASFFFITRQHVAT